MKRGHEPSYKVAWGQALASIRVRFFRQAVTSIGIGLGIAFFCSVQVYRLAQPPTDLQADSRLKWLIGASLAMCLVGITNSMLMSVAERYREIGTIKCLGASDGFIVAVFFLEALLLGFVGSLVGAVVGCGVLRLVLGGVSFGSLAGIVALGTAVGTSMTVVAAIVPAIQAAKMPAAAALRVEV